VSHELHSQFGDNMKLKEAIEQGLLIIGARVTIFHQESINKGTISYISDKDFGIKRFDGVSGTGPDGAWVYRKNDPYILNIVFIMDNRGYMPLLYEIKIQDKPQGNWRPAVRIEFYPIINPLNIQTEIRAAIIREGYEFPSPIDEGRIVCRIPGRIYLHASRWKESGQDSYIAGASESLWAIRCTDNWYSFSFHIEQGFWGQFYLDWRPGLNPSYADYAKHLKRGCDLIVAEYNRRCREALSSGESPEIIITPEAELPERKEVVRKIRMLNQE